MSRIEYVIWWLDAAKEEIQKNPNSNLHEFTHPNFSGGKRGWETEISKVYFTPSSINEHILRGKIHEILLIALRRTLMNIRAGRGGIFGNRLDLAEAYRIGMMISERDPIFVSRLNIQINRLCKLFLGTSFAAEAERGFGLLMKT